MTRSEEKRHPEYQYLDILQEILDHGDKRMDRTGVGTLALFGRHMRFDVSNAFPVLTTRKIYWQTAIKEMLWILSGSTSIRDLLKERVHFWTDWPWTKYRRETGEEISRKDFETRILEDRAFAEKWGDLGPVYGKQWRRWLTSDGREIDQIQAVIDQIKSSPRSRRILWTGWNVGELDQMALPPCHKTYQAFVSSDGKLSLAVNQRSADFCIGVAGGNLIGLALLVHMLAKETDLEPGEAIWYGMDVHVYLNHVEQAREQLSRTPRPWPTLRIKRKAPTLFDYTIDDFELEGYDPHPPIKLPIAV